MGYLVAILPNTLGFMWSGLRGHSNPLTLVTSLIGLVALLTLSIRQCRRGVRITADGRVRMRGLWRTVTVDRADVVDVNVTGGTNLGQFFKLPTITVQYKSGGKVSDVSTAMSLAEAYAVDTATTISRELSLSFSGRRRYFR